MANSKICSVTGCGNPVRAKELCSPHYMMMRRHGDPTICVKPNQNKAIPWLHAHANYSGNDCLKWPFNTAKTTGYGKILFRGRHMPASRAMCIIAHDDPPTPKHQAAHECGKGHEGCVNPKHLCWAPPYRNLQDRMKHGTGRHLTEKQKKEIAALARTVSGCEIARLYGFSQSTISRFLTGARPPKYT